jgi:hypothetical protein
MAKNKETWALGSSAAFENLKNISERRTDIFGAGDVETGIGMEISNQKRVSDAPVFFGCIPSCSVHPILMCFRFRFRFR